MMAAVDLPGNPSRKHPMVRKTVRVNPDNEMKTPFEHAIRVGKRRASRKAEIDVPRVGGDVAEHVLHLSAEAEPDRDGVDLLDRRPIRTRRALLRE